ncbi:MAG: hypothetical protein ACKV2Q_36455 [Planctomycetaceae bacterium]
MQFQNLPSYAPPGTDNAPSFQDQWGPFLPALGAGGLASILFPGAENLPLAITQLGLGAYDRAQGQLAGGRSWDRTAGARGELGSLYDDISGGYNNPFAGGFRMGGQNFGSRNGPRFNLDEWFGGGADMLRGYQPGQIAGGDIDFAGAQYDPVALQSVRDQALGRLDAARLAPGSLFAQSGFGDAATAARASGLSSIAGSTAAEEDAARRGVLADMGGRRSLQDIGGSLESAGIGARRAGIGAAQNLESGLTQAEFGARTTLGQKEADINAGLAGQGAGIISELGGLGEQLRARSLSDILGQRLVGRGQDIGAQGEMEGLRLRGLESGAEATDRGEANAGTQLFNMLQGQQGGNQWLAQTLAGLGIHSADLLAGFQEPIFGTEAPFNRAVGTWQQMQQQQAANDAASGGWF